MCLVFSRLEGDSYIPKGHSKPMGISRSLRKRRTGKTRVSAAGATPPLRVLPLRARPRNFAL